MRNNGCDKEFEPRQNVRVKSMIGHMVPLNINDSNDCETTGWVRTAPALLPTTDGAGNTTSQWYLVLLALELCYGCG